MVDAARAGNFCRFLNHSCDPNLVVQPVLSAHHDRTLAKFCFFACQNIKPEQQLTCATLLILLLASPHAQTTRCMQS